MYELFDRKKLVLGCFNPNYLFLDNRVELKTESELIKDSWRYASTDLHENIHWFQHAGTTWGNYCLHLNQTVIFSFDNYSFFSNIDSLIENINKIEFDEKYYLKRDQKYPREQLLFKQSWIDYFATTFLLMSGDNIPTELINRCVEGIGFIRSDLYGQINELNGINIVNEIEELYRRCSFKKYKFTDIDGSSINIKNLYESQARVNDIYYKIATLQYGRDVSDINIFDNDNYWLAFKHYIKCSGYDINNVIKNTLINEILKFNAIVDISLNPPIFPYQDDTCLKWEDYFPVERFYKLCKINSEIDKDYIIENDNDYLRFVNCICKKIQWDSPENISRKYIEKHFKRIDEFEYEWENNTTNISLFALYDYYQYLYLKFSKMRLEFPTIISNYSFNCIGDNLVKSIKYVLDNEEWLRCPLQMNTNNDEIMTKLKDNQYTWMFLQVLKSNIIKNNLLMNKNIDKNSFPFNVKNGFKEYLIKEFKSQYGIEIDWKL